MTLRAFNRERVQVFADNKILTATGTFRLLRSRDDVRSIALIAAIALCYLVAAKLGFSLAFATKQVTAIWPPTGIALTTLLLFGLRMWPGVFIGAFLANATSGEPLLTAVGVAVGNTLTGVVGAHLLLSFFRIHITFERARDVLSLVTVALLSALISATLGTLNLALVNIVAWSEYASVWLVWWVGDTLGIVLVAPFLLSWWMRPSIKWREWRLLEYVAFLVGVTTLSYLAFARESSPEQPYHVLTYSTYPFLVWAAFRFGQREVVSGVLIVSVIAVWGTVHNRGPFTQGTLDERLIALDTFAAVTAVTALLLGAMTAERRRSQGRLRRARDQLERRVNLRTSELERANKELYDLSYSMSHDLRAPLRAVNSFSELLNAKYADVIDAEGTRYLGIIAKNSRNMGQMIEDYLRLFRLHDEVLKIEPLNSETLVRDVVEELFTSQPSNKVRFDIRALPMAAGDAGLIRQVWINLLDNAVKFSRKHEQPVVEIGGYVSAGRTMYYVRDNGVGFDMEWSEQLYKVFQRFHPTEFEGIGVGLAVAARIIHRHGGEILAVGDVGRGATFTFVLPQSIPANS